MRFFFLPRFFHSFNRLSPPGLPICNITAWAKVRNEASDEITYLVASYVTNSKTDVQIIDKGSGGIQGCCQNLPNDRPLFGGAKLSSGRFVSFLYNGNNVGIMLKGRASMHKNGGKCKCFLIDPISLPSFCKLHVI